MCQIIYELISIVSAACSSRRRRQTAASAAVWDRAPAMATRRSSSEIPLATFLNVRKSNLSSLHENSKFHGSFGIVRAVEVRL